MSTEMNLRLDPRVVIYCSTNSSKRSSHCKVEAQLHYNHEEYLKYKTLSRESTSTLMKSFCRQSEINIPTSSVK